ncbi:Retinol dehydrogenase 13 [Toxocara canis]|uniref:Retinol dehydrogenase 13 n=1 Tax=Toxocara canis TaxID=6265 RepID=A0A0B2ULV9_TOXCA|nr:Retinol dehydrogenase 13 [Toxocara canis]
MNNTEKSFEVVNAFVCARQVSSTGCILYTFVAMLSAWVVIRVWYKLTSGQCIFEESLKGKVFLITGCTSGIGYEAAKELYGHDATVVMLIRNVRKGLECVEQIQNLYPRSDGGLRIVPVDLSSLKSVRLCARMINNTEPAINVLVNNAAIGSAQGHKASLTSDDLEEVMASNFFGHFLLTMLLLPRLRATKGSRIISTSSLIHSLHRHLPVDSLNFENEYYDGFNAYIRSKLAIVIMSRHLSRLVSVHDASFFSCNPGILATQLSRYFIRKFFGNRLGDLMYPLSMIVNKFIAKTTHEGAQTTLSLCVQKGVEQYNGGYFSDCRPAKCSPLADDIELGRCLFRETVRLVGLRETALHTQLNTASTALDAEVYCETRMYHEKNLSDEDSEEDSRSESEQDIDMRNFF